MRWTDVGTGGSSGTGGVPSTGGTNATPCETYCSTLSSLRRAALTYRADAGRSGRTAGTSERIPLG